MRKRIFSLCMVLALCLSLLPVTTLAAGGSYVALGDSVTTGYAPTSISTTGKVASPFANQVAEDTNYALKNLATDGETSTSLLEKLTSSNSVYQIDADVKLITITIGGNDLMGALYESVAKFYNQMTSGTVTGAEIQQALMGMHPSIDQETALTYLALSLQGFVTSGMEGTLEAFRSNLSGILQKLQEDCPEAQILLTNQYNPYGILKAFDDYAALAEQFETGVGKLNTAISEVCQEFGVTVVDVHAVFAQALAAGNNPCNAGIDESGNLNPDFHPNQAGHNLIAEAITAALADEPESEVNLYVGEVALHGNASAPAYATTDKAGAVTPGGSEENYNLKWDGTTLTLKNANITGAYPYTDCYGDSNSAAIYCDGNMELVLVGENTVTNSPIGNEYGNGISAMGDLTISGSGSVTATGSYDAISSYAGNLTITSGVVTAEGGSGGISIYDGDLIVEGGTVTATTNGNYVTWNYALFVVGNCTISGGKVTATANGESNDINYACGIAVFTYDNSTSSGNLTISGGEATFSVTGTGTDAYKYGVYLVNSFTIEDGTVTATASDGEACGIFATKDAFIKGGTVTATSDYVGIYTYTDGIFISGGTVTAAGDYAGIYACLGDTILSGGTVTSTSDFASMHSYNSDIIVSPQAGWQIAVTAGVDKDSSMAIDGSPFRQETVISDLINEKTYFRSETSLCPSSGDGDGDDSSDIKTEIVTKPDGTVIETTRNPDGSQKVVGTKPDGTVTITTTDKNGKVVSEATLSEAAVEAAQEAGGAVALPMPAVPVTTDRDSAPTVTVNMPDSSAKVEIPVANVTPGTVAVLVKADGTEEIIKTSLTTETGLAVVLSDGDTVKIVDNSKEFADVPENYWGSNYIDFVTSREIFSGTGTNTFSPDTAVTRGMIVTVLAAYDGADTSSAGGAWYEAGRQWAMDNGISDGTNMENALTREQLVTMLWRYAQVKGYDTAQGGMAIREFTDFGQVSDYAVEAMTWAVNAGLISGTTATTLSPQAEATRAQVAVMLQRFCELGK